MANFEKQLVVKATDLDDLDHVNNVRYVQWIQDISKEHWQSLASEELQKRVAWVVMHHDITYKNAAKLNDLITVKTYIESSRGATSVRVVEIYDDKTKRLLVRSITEWCLLNAKTFRPMRISEEIVRIFQKA